MRKRKTVKRTSLKNLDTPTPSKKEKVGEEQIQIGRDENVEEDEKMEEFYAILRRYHTAMKYFKTNNNSNNEAKLTRRSCSSSCPTLFGSQDFQVNADRNVNANVNLNDNEKLKGAEEKKKIAEEKKKTFGFDLNAVPVED